MQRLIVQRQQSIIAVTALLFHFHMLDRFSKDLESDFETFLH